MTAIWWIRRDLRLRDNPALCAAMAFGQVLPVFILDPYLLRNASQRRQRFLFASLRDLGEQLGRRGALLVIRRGEPGTVLQRLLAESSSSIIVAEEDFTPYARRRDKDLATRLPLQLVRGQLVHDPRDLLKPDGTPYVVFGPFARAWRSRLPSRLDLSEPPERIQGAPRLTSDMPESAMPADEEAGGDAAIRRLAGFVQERIFHYAEDRDRLDRAGTSGLSPYLHFGSISMPRVVEAAREAAQMAPDVATARSAEVWLNELVWREFYIHVMHHFPQVRRRAFRPTLERIPWRNSHREFEAWTEGRTGVPVVDAAMRQLSQTGRMPNRARMIAASYLVKDLLVDWRWGEQWFMKQLLDADVSSNNGGWQWTAGTGTDAAPYFRVFNPVLQGRKYDPHGDYVREWVPELADLDGSIIHAPWERGVRPAGYPAEPLVDHAEAVRRTRAAYAAARQSGARTDRVNPGGAGGVGGLQEAGAAGGED